jgi:hypothetical protein
MSGKTRRGISLNAIQVTVAFNPFFEQGVGLKAKRRPCRFHVTGRL